MLFGPNVPGNFTVFHIRQKKKMKCLEVGGGQLFRCRIIVHSVSECMPTVRRKKKSDVHYKLFWRSKPWNALSMPELGEN